MFSFLSVCFYAFLFYILFLFVYFALFLARQSWLNSFVEYFLQSSGLFYGAVGKVEINVKFYSF